MSQLDVHNAKRALAARLAAWGIATDAASKANGFIDDLVAIGWQMSPAREIRKLPPKLADECRKHIGQYADNCGGCRSDDKRTDDEPIQPMTKDELRAALAANRRTAKETK